MNQIKKQTLFFFFFVSLIFIGGLPHVADAAGIDACQKLGGDTTVISTVVKDDKGFQYVVDNSGQNYFDGIMPSQNNQPVYLAPNKMAACAERVGNTVYLKGWFWNDNLGWISLYCPGDGGTNRGVPCGFVKYGVTLDAFGNFSGYAWSSVGWIRMTCKATPGFNDVDICAQSAFKVKMNFNAPANNRTWFPYTLAWSDTVGWFEMDSIKIPWNTIKDVLIEPPATFNDPPLPECKTGGIANPDICLREEDYIPDDIPDIPVVDPGVKKLTPSGAPKPGDDFPVTWNKIRYLGNDATSGNTTKALNPVTQADVRNLIYRNVIKWKKVASTSCGGGDYITKFTSTDEVFYCKGDVFLDASINNWKGNKTIIVEDGDVHIKDSIYSQSGQFGIITLRSKVSSKLKGNIYIYPKVRELRVQMYADGLVLPANFNGGLATDIDYAITGGGADNETLFGQLYIRGMIIAGNSGSYAADGSVVSLSDLSALRSVPASPFDTKKAIQWSTYFDALESGNYVATTKEEVDKIKSTQSISGANASPTLTTEQKKKTLPPESKLDAPKKQSLITKKTPDKTKFIQSKDPTTYSEGVILQFEPPSSTLAGFEGVLGNAYRQTR